MRKDFDAEKSGGMRVYFLIKETLEECSAENIKESGFQYVAVLSFDEWKKDRETFNMGIDIEPDIHEIHTTSAAVNFDSLTGTFCILNRNNLYEEKKFAFALDEKGVVFIDDGGAAMEIIEEIRRTKKWRFPSLERFLYDFLEQIVKDDMRLIEGYEHELDAVEQEIISGKEETTLDRVNVIRGDIRDLQYHYDQLTDLAAEFEENENHFFKAENLRYFRLFLNRMSRLNDAARSIRDYTMQIRDLFKSQLDIKQNRIITILTVVTTIFMPLTLIAGWYGMNFRYMPELDTVWGYPVVIGVSLLIVVLGLVYFKKKKWL